MTRVDVAVVIVSWNTRDYLEACIRSVLRLTQGITFEVFVVDNASHDGSAEMVRRSFPVVRVVANTTNRGFAAANNQALQLADARYALLLNPDTRLLDGAIQNVVGFADSDPGIAVVGCQVLEHEGKVQATCFRFPSPLNLLLVWSGIARLMPRSRWLGRATMGHWNRDTMRDVDVVSGMFMLVRREAMEKVGLMDESYFVYAEEADWCFRFRRAGWRCVFAPVGRVQHMEGGGRSTAQAGIKMYVQMQKSLLIFHRKNLGWPAWLCARIIYVCAMVPRAAYWRLRSLFGGGTPARLKARCAEAALRYHLLGLEPR